MMYEKRHSRFHCTKRFRTAFWLGNWIIVALACYLSLQSCGKLRYTILCNEVDTTYRSYNDTCIVEIWYRPFPRSKTTFRVKPAN